MLQVGDKAPENLGVDHTGKEYKTSDFTGKKLIIYFYPKDATPGCTQQACNLRDGYTELIQAGFQVLGVSMDSAKSHERFIEKQQLPFPLLVDDERKLIDAFGVWGRKKFMGREYDGIFRTTFIINESGIIERIIEKPKVKEHTQEILN